MFIKIKDIINGGQHHTYDLTVKDNHSYFCNGLAVHNTSTKDPAMQTLPKHTSWSNKLREAYTPPKGKKFFQLDYSQGELRVIACVANEINMINAYKKGIDLHIKTGAGLTNNGTTPQEWADLKKRDEKLYKFVRQNGKAGNFGLIYDISVGGYVQYAKATYGVTLSMEEGEHHHKQFFDTYPALLDYHKRCRATARKKGFVESPLGRLRHLPMINNSNPAVRSQAERQSINSPIQGTLSDCCIWAISIIEQKYAMDYNIEIAGMTHDSIYGYVDEGNSLEALRICKQVMENLPFHKFNWEPQLKFIVDAEIGSSMADLQEIKL